MTDQSLRRADELLTELVEQVETARAVPMSSSCVLPRERLLDLLDELREVLPPEIDEARRVIASRDVLLHDAYAGSDRGAERAAQESEAMAANALTRAGEVVHDAEVRAYNTVEQGQAEHASLVSATSVHQSAARAVAELRQDAEQQGNELRQQAAEYHRTVIADADRYAADVRTDAERYAAKLSADSEDYADRTLYELATTLQRAAATAEQGRVALAHRRSGHDAEAGRAVPADAEARPGHGDHGEATDDLSTEGEVEVADHDLVVTGTADSTDAADPPGAVPDGAGPRPDQSAAGPGSPPTQPQQPDSVSV